MLLNEFIQGDSDENLLKSLPTENISEGLVKAMNKSGLVQKEIQVRGKNGQTFTRKQWVRASDTQSDKSSSSKSQDKEDTKTDISGSKWEDKLNAALYSAQGTAADYAVGKVLQELPKGTVIKTGQKAALASPPYKAEVTYTKCDNDSWQYISKDFDKVYYNSVSKALCKVKDNSKFKLSISVPETKVHTKEQSESVNDKNTAIIVDGGSITHYPKGITPKFHGGKSYKYSAHVNGSTGADKYFNSENEAKSYIKEQSEGKFNHTTGTYDKSKKPSMIQDYFAGKRKDMDGKSALATLLSKGYTRQDIMSQAETSGITWKKNDHEGINWMRASMAIQKAWKKG